MPTVADNLSILAEMAKNTAELLLRHSSLRRWNEPGSMVIAMNGNYVWNDLNITGQQAQAKALEEYRHLSSIVAALLRGQPQNILIRKEREFLHEPCRISPR